MKRIPLPDTRLTLSRFSFGTASLHHLGALGKQVRHLRAALEAGFSHFDTAPLYGFGMAERALGRAFGDARSEAVTIATKVGLYPPGGAAQGRMAMLARKIAGKALPAMSRARADWHVARAMESLDGSLARLQRDTIDLLLLHEPELGLLHTDEWLRWLEMETARRVGAFGLAGPPVRIAPFLVADSPLARVLQLPDSVAGREADFLKAHSRPLQLTYGYLSAAPAKPDARAETVLADALQRNRTGSVIVSSRRQSRLSIFAAIAEQDDLQDRTAC